MTTTNYKISKLRKELEIVRMTNPKKKLLPSDVVEYAKNNPDSHLHSRFNWNVNEAAEAYWLSQATDIIRKVKITIITPSLRTSEARITVRKYVSIPDDRVNGEGYQVLGRVLTHSETKLQLIESVKSDLISIQKKLANLSSVANKHLDAAIAELSKESKNISKEIRKDKIAG